jgi:hypothetical protein
VAERLLVLAILIVTVGIPTGITLSKERYVAFVLGFLLLGMIWVVTACRLARPSSWWARHFYDEKKMQRALSRFDSDGV